LTTDQARRILNVVGDYDKSSLKSLYRLKAKQLHPDRNTNVNAQVEFIQLKKAYDLLLRNFLHPQQKTIGINIPSEKEVRKARAYHQHKKRSQKEANEKRKAADSYEQFIKSSAFIWHKILLAIAFVLICVYVFDAILPSQETVHELNEFVFEYPIKGNGGLLKQKTYFEGITFYTTPNFKTNTNIVVVKSGLIGLVQEIRFNAKYCKQIFIASKSMFLLLLAGLFFPVLGYLIKGPNIYFLMSVRWSQIAIPFILLFIAIEQGKMIAIF
jgi:hypothetical protein